jgi:hypothetical protein
MKILVNKNIFPFVKGQIVHIEEKEGTPKESFWRRRLLDSKIDNCCEVIKESVPLPTEEVQSSKASKKKGFKKV